MKCPKCKGKGFKEYDAGLVQIYCETCEGTGKVKEALTKEEFERAYAFRSDMTVDQVRELGLEAVPSEDCVQGWAMMKIAIPAPAVILEIDGAKVAQAVAETIIEPPPPEDTDPGVVIKEGGFQRGEPPSVPTEKPREPKSGEYFCPKCNSLHRKTSKIGIKHLKGQS